VLYNCEKRTRCAVDTYMAGWVRKQCWKW